MTLSCRAAAAALLVCSLGLPASAWRQRVDPALRAAVDRFFATQEAEDVEAYLSLWSASATRPRPELLRFVFASGDDTFSDIEIVDVQPAGGGIRVRVSAARDRAEIPRRPGATPVVQRTRMHVSLTYVREGDEWKLLREAPAADDLAQALLDAPSAEERTRLLEANRELFGERLLTALSRRGTEAAQSGRYADAQAAFERTLEAARRTGNQEVEGDALQNLGNALYFQRHFSAALDAYEQRTRLERARGNDEGLAAALAGIATIRYSFAEYGPALAAYREALAIQELVADPSAVATTLVSVGNVLYLRGEYDAAIREYARSRAISQKNLDTFGVARALDGLGRVLMVRGDYAGALQAFTGVLEEGRARNDPAAQGNAGLNVGDAHFRLGNLDAARKAFEESRRHFETSKDLANAGRVWQAIALTDLAAGRYGEAERGYITSATSCTSAGDAECLAGAAAGLGFAQTAQDKFTEAAASYRKAVQMFTAQRRAEQAARAEIGLSQAQSGAGEHEAALEAAARARQAAVVLDSDDLLWRALVAEARALRRQGEREQASAAARAAVSAVGRLLDTAGLRPTAPVSQDTAWPFACLAILQAEAGDAAAAFETAERMRVHELRVALAPVEREIAAGMTEAERAAERAAAAHLASLHAQLTREKGLPKPDAARVERLERSLAEAAAQRADQMKRVFDRLPALRVWRGLAEPAARPEVEALLQDDRTTLVHFVADDQDLLVLYARRKGSGVEFMSRIAAISRRALAERVAALVHEDALGSADRWKQVSAALLETLPELVPELIAAPKAIVMPHEVLWRVPFEALPADDGSVADRTTVVYAQSVTAIVALPPHAGRTPDAPALVFGAASPAIAASLAEQVGRTAPGWNLRAADAADRELRAIVSGLAPEEVRLSIGAEATEGALRSALASSDVIHVGAPFRINAASPLYSPILLAGEGLAPAGSPADGVLELREIMTLELRGRLVVLSDGAAMSMRNAADESVLVRWGWRAAGVRTLLLPRWQSDERASTTLLADFHRRVRSGEAPEEALQAARAALRAQALFAAPYFWAGWVLFTDR